MTTSLSTLRRPRLLIRAARFGVSEYDRRRTLPRLVNVDRNARAETIVDALMTAEADAEVQRKAGLATYSFARHIEILAALIFEARHMARQVA